MSNKPLQQPFCSTREAAAMLGVSQRTVQNWAESGLLTAWKTDGGHRRITLQSIENLQKHKITAPVATSETASKEKPLQILIAEDDDILQQTYEAMLPTFRRPIQTTIVGNGIEALIQIGLQQPDLLIADIMMPGMDGAEMIRSIRNTTELQHMQILIISSLTQQELVEEYHIAETIPFLTKPIHFDKLERLISELFP